MGFFDIFKKHNNTNKNIESVTSPTRKTRLLVGTDFDPVVLLWIKGKKKGYDRLSNKYPKWFASRYQIDFNAVLNKYISDGFLYYFSENVIKLTETGEMNLKLNDHIIFLHNHPSCKLSVSDFINSPNFQKVSTNDIAWGLYNSKLIPLTVSCKWDDLSLLYYNMSQLLIEENRYRDSMDFIFATEFLQVSGIHNDNEVSAIMQTVKNHKRVDLLYENGMPQILGVEIWKYSVISPFLKIQEELSLDWKEIKKIYMSSRLVNSLNDILPFKYFDINEAFNFFKQALDSKCDGNIFTLSNLTKKLKINKPDPHSTTYFYASIENKMIAYRK